MTNLLDSPRGEGARIDHPSGVGDGPVAQLDFSAGSAAADADEAGAAEGDEEDWRDRAETSKPFCSDGS